MYRIVSAAQTRGAEPFSCKRDGEYVNSENTSVRLRLRHASHREHERTDYYKVYNSSLFPTLLRAIQPIFGISQSPTDSWRIPYLGARYDPDWDTDITTRLLPAGYESFSVYAGILFPHPSFRFAVLGPGLSPNTHQVREHDWPATEDSWSVYESDISVH